MRERTYLEARRAAAQDSTRPTDRLAVSTALFGGMLVMLVLVTRSLLLPGPSLPSVAHVLNPDTQAPHVQSGFVPPNNQP